MGENSLHKVWLSLGTNLGDKKSNLNNASDMLIKGGCHIIGESSIYTSTAWGYESENDFYNICLVIETVRNPMSCLKLIIEIESGMGRVPGNNQYNDRIIDIDILFFDDLILETEHLIIPHPRMEERLFVLKPLSEISSDKIHPLINKSIKFLAENCDDKSFVQRIS